MFGDQTKAIDWLNKAEGANVFGIASNLIKCAALRLEIGDKVAGTRLLLKAAKTFEQPTGVNVRDQLFGECAYLLTQAGQKQEVRKLTKIYNDQVAAFKDTGMFEGYGWSRKMTEPVYELRSGVWIRRTRATQLAEQEALSRARRLNPGEGQVKAQMAQTERLRTRLNPQALMAIEESNRRTKEFNERKSKEADGSGFTKPGLTSRRKFGEKDPSIEPLLTRITRLKH